jgi:hypothetical protein
MCTLITAVQGLSLNILRDELHLNLQNYLSFKMLGENF